MRPTALRAATLVVAQLALAVLPALAASPDLGRQIYEQGLGADGREIVAVLGSTRTEVPASLLPCVNCHGSDGRGRAEGGVSPSDLTWETLTKPYGLRHPTGRRHPPYDERSLAWAIGMGEDPSGNSLGEAMPRYRLTDREAKALVAFIRQLGLSPAPGVSDTRVLLGVLLPPPELAGLGDAVEGVLTALVERQNQTGGLYGRRLELLFLSTAGPPASRRSVLAEQLEQADPFALVAGFIAGADAELAGLAAELEIPLVGPFTLDPQVGLPLNPYVFYLLSGLEQQGRALVDFASSHLEQAPRRAVVIHPADERSRGVAMAIREQGLKQRAHSWPAIETVELPSGETAARAIVEAQRAAGTEVLFPCGSESDVRAVLQAAAEADWQPYVFLPSALAGALDSTLPIETARRTYLASPLLASDRNPRTLAGYRRLMTPPAPAHHESMQLAAIAATEVLLEGLRGSGRELTRERLIEELEKLYDFRTGLLPPITYGVSRRIGSLGAHILAFDEERQRFVPSGDWVSPR